MHSSPRGTSIQVKQRLTRALLKFCRDHGYPETGLSEIRKCLEALERGDLDSAGVAYHKVPLGGRMGYFDEWFPPVAFDHETSEYVYVVFETLLAQWSLVMDPDDERQ